MSVLPSTSSMALKEWAVAVVAMASGEQITTLRKGGIHRDDKEFRVVHPQFLLYPTYEHQKEALLKAGYHSALRDTLAEDDTDGLVKLSFWCQVTDVFELRDVETLERLSPHHIWTSDYAEKRLHWRPKHPLAVVLLRVYRLSEPRTLPVLDKYVGCKSWVELEQDVRLGHMTAVLSDDDYAERADAIRGTLAGTPVAPL